MFKELEKHFGVLKLPVGHVVYQQGDKDQDGYVLVKGRVELSRKFSGDMIERGVFITEGQVFGVFTALFGTESRRWNAITVELSEIIMIPAQTLMTKIDAMDPFLKYCLSQWYSLEHSKK